jgi:hypothetical protein
MTEGATVFFPLYALLTRAVAVAVGDYIVAGLIVSTGAAVFAFTFMILLGEHLFGARREIATSADVRPRGDSAAGRLPHALE